jgi:hypothetical protein
VAESLFLHRAVLSPHRSLKTIRRESISQDAALHGIHFEASQMVQSGRKDLPAG